MNRMGKVGIHVEFVSVPRSDEVTKMQTLMSSGTAPGITITYTYSYAEDYFNQGGIWDLSEFIDGGEGQAQNMKAYLGRQRYRYRQKIQKETCTGIVCQTRHNG